MFEGIRQEWRRFSAERAGERFVRHYERKRGDEAKGLLRRLGWIAAGIFFLLAGFVMLFTPGPGLLAIGFGATCLAQESHAMARFCDRSEVSIRRAWARFRRRAQS